MAYAVPKQMSFTDIRTFLIQLVQLTRISKNRLPSCGSILDIVRKDVLQSRQERRKPTMSLVLATMGAARVRALAAPAASTRSISAGSASRRFISALTGARRDTVSSASDFLKVENCAPPN